MDFDDLTNFHEWPFIFRFLTLCIFYCFLGWMVHKEPDAGQLCAIAGFIASFVCFAKEISNGSWG